MATIITRAGKGSPLENDEVDANFTNLNNDKVETSALNELVDDRVSTLIVPGLGITTDYDDTAGTLTIDSDTIEELCKNGTGSTILKGTPVYQTGTAGNAMVIAPADASSAATMPAVGVLSQDLAAAAEGSLILMGRISGIDTSAFSEGDVIYVASGGGYTNTRPTGESVLVQNLGRVTKVHASNGGGVVMGSGRANDVPNLTDGNIFIGNASGTYDKRAIVTADISDLTATATELNYTDGVTSSIQTQLDTKAPLASPTFTGTVTIPAATVTGDVSFGDNDKAIFGADSDLQIYHDGANSYIDEVGTGSFYIRGTHMYLQRADGSENYIGMLQDGAVTLYNNGAAKLATTSIGINVTGTATMDGLTVDGAGTAVFSGGQYIQVDGDAAGVTDLEPVLWARSKVGASIPQINVKGSQWQFGGGGTLDANPAMTIDYASGDISFYEDTGTTPKFFWDASAERLGVGTSSPDATGLHVHTGSAGTLTPNSSADDLVVESDANAGITIASPDASYSGIIFSSPADPTGSIIEYNHSGATFDIGTATSGGVLKLRSGNFSEAMRIDSSGTLIHKAAAVFNEDGGDSDFRVESDTRSAMLFVDASTDRVGINTDAPQEILEVRGKVLIESNNAGLTDPNNELILSDSDTTTDTDQLMGRISFNTKDTSNPGTAAKIQTRATNSLGSGELQIWSGTAPTLAKNAMFRGDQVVFNEDSNDMDFRVESDSNTHALFVNAGNSRVGINASDVYAHFQINPITSVVGNQSIAISGSKTYYVNSQWGLIQNQMMVFDNNTSAATGIGGGISLGGNCGGTQDTWLATIESWKQNSTSGNYDGGLKIKTRLNNDPEMRERVHFKTDEAAFNDVSLNYDFRVESDTNTHALFVDASANLVNIGDSSSAWTAPSLVVSAPMLDLSSSTARTTNAGIVLRPSSAVDTNGWYGMLFANSTLDSYGYTIGGRRTGASGLDAALDFRFHNNSTSGSSRIYITNGTTIFNADSSDQDFRVHSNTNTHALFVDAGNSTVSVNRSGGAGQLNVKRTSSGEGIHLYNSANAYPAGSTGYTDITGTFYDYLTGGDVQGGTAIVRFDSTNAYHTARSAQIILLSTPSDGTNVAREIARFNTGSVTFNEFSFDQDFRVESDTDANALFLDASTSRIGIGINSPTATLHIERDGIQDILVERKSPAVGNVLGEVKIGASSSFVAGMRADVRSGQPGVDRIDLTLHTTTYTSSLQSFIERVRFYDQGQVAFNDNSENYDFRVESDTNTHALFVDASANCVGFNKSSPTRTVDIEGASEPLGVKLTAGSLPVIRSEHYSSTNANWYHIRFFTGTGAGGAILVNGLSGTVTYSTTSDYRLKENVVDMTGAIDRVKTLNPVRFNWKQAPNGRLVDGFIAHEVSEIVPEAVVGEKDAIDENGNIDPQGIDQAKLVPLLTAALQEAIKRIETLEAEVSALKP
jgi:hypothetical protein